MNCKCNDNVRFIQCECDEPLTNGPGDNGFNGNLNFQSFPCDIFCPDINTNVFMFHAITHIYTFNTAGFINVPLVQQDSRLVDESMTDLLLG